MGPHNFARAKVARGARGEIGGMTLRDQLLMLHELHQIDAQIHILDLKLAEAPRQAAELSLELEKNQRSLVDALKRQDSNEVERRQAERDLAADKEKVHKWEARLNDIRNSREFAALQRETEGLKRQNRDSEEKILEMMAVGEALSKEINDLSDATTSLEDKFKKTNTAVQAEIAELEAEIAALRASQQDTTERVRPSILKKYEHIRQGRGGLALAIVHEGTCDGCHMTLPPQLYIELQRVGALEICPNCQRILFWDGLLKSADDSEHDGATA